MKESTKRFFLLLTTQTGPGRKEVQGEGSERHAWISSPSSSIFNRSEGAAKLHRPKDIFLEKSVFKSLYKRETLNLPAKEDFLHPCREIHVDSVWKSFPSFIDLVNLTMQSDAVESERSECALLCNLSINPIQSKKAFPQFGCLEAAHKRQGSTGECAFLTWFGIPPLILTFFQLNMQDREVVKKATTKGICRSSKPSCSCLIVLTCIHRSWSNWGEWDSLLPKEKDNARGASSL